MLPHEYTYAYGAVDVVTGELDSLILSHVNTACMQIFLDEVAARHPQRRIIMVLVWAGWHRSEALRIPTNMRLLSLPPYAPELNPVEHVWDELREKHFRNKAFDSMGALEDQLSAGLMALEKNQLKLQSMVAWDWVVNALLIYKWNYVVRTAFWLAPAMRLGYDWRKKNSGCVR